MRRKRISRSGVTAGRDLPRKRRVDLVEVGDQNTILISVDDGLFCHNPKKARAAIPARKIAAFLKKNPGNEFDWESLGDDLFGRFNVRIATCILLFKKTGEEPLYTVIPINRFVSLLRDFPHHF